MNKEEIEELKDFTIDLTDIDELALGLEVCSKKSNMVIQELADTIIQLQQENQKLKKQLEEKNKPQIFIDTQDIEERYAEGLYQDYLQQENKELKEVIDKAIKYIMSNDIEVLKYHDIPSETTSYEIVTVDLLKILNRIEDSE